MARKRSDQVPFKDVLTSSTFKFVVGLDKQEFILHKQLVASLSPVLDLLMNGQMKEALDGCVEWDDVDEETFIRFSQFAYSGKYEAAEPEPAPRKPTNPTGGSAGKRGPEASPPRKRARVEEYYLPTPQKDETELSESSSGSGSEETETNSEVDETSDSDEDDDDDDDDDDDSEEASDDDDEEVDSDDESSGSEVSAVDDYHKPTNLPYSLESFADWWRDVYGRHTQVSRGSLKRKRSMAHEGHTIPLFKHQDLKYGLILHFLRALDAREPTAPPDVWRNWNAFQDYTPVFLGHARLYVLADRYDIKTLRELTSYNIHTNLKQFVLYYERVPDVAALIRYVYDNTTDTSGLRSLLATYAACIIEDVRNHPDFAECVDNIADFSRDLVYQMTYRLL